MQVERISSFSVSDTEGGNPAGVVLLEVFPSDAEMQACAAKVGYSETAFAHPHKDGWRVRYFAPIGEVGFCGHATIALGAALANRFGSAAYPLYLNDYDIVVDAMQAAGKLSATLVSPPTSQNAPDAAFLDKALHVFGLGRDDLDPRITPIIADAGMRHLVLPLTSRAALAAMKYDMDEGREIMAQENLITVMLVHAENNQMFHSRNPFAIGGVYEDPATGAASAAFGGYLNSLNWPHQGEINILQGEDMGMPSKINVKISGPSGSPVFVGGQARFMESGA